MAHAINTDLKIKLTVGTEMIMYVWRQEGLQQKTYPNTRLFCFSSPKGAAATSFLSNYPPQRHTVSAASCIGSYPVS